MKAILESTLGALMFQNCALKAEVAAKEAETAKLRDLLTQAEAALKAMTANDPVAKPPETA